VTMNEQRPICRGEYLVIDGNTIVEIGVQNDLDPHRKFDAVEDLSGKLVMPGLINAHTHTPMILFRGHSEGHSLFTLDGWFNTVRVLEAVMDPEMLPSAVAVSCAEMIRSGTTCFADQYFWMDQIIPTVRQSGLRAVLAYGIVELGNPEAREREIAAARDFLYQLNGDPLLSGWIGPHAFYVDNSEIAMQKELQLSEQFNTGFHIHFGTSGEEDRYCQEKYQQSAISHLDTSGFLYHPIIAAHCITLLEADFHKLRNKPFTVVFAPSSGMKNAAGVAPLIKLLGNEINLALGTDNVTNNNSYDMFKEMALTGKLMAFLTHDAAALSAKLILEMATIGGARAMGKEREIGSLDVGKKADLIALDLEEVGWSPRDGQDIYTALVYSITGQHVRDVMVDGNWLFRNNRWLTIDHKQQVQLLESQHEELMRRVNSKR
jgi:5-methylthioadenosine/S-adenosylhomocysteine deaminase